MPITTIGRYDIIREIARSNDVVYEGYDSKIGRHVALKELLLPPTVTAEQRAEREQRFQREVKAAGRLSHPSIMTIFDFGEDHGRMYLVMELLDGCSLRKKMEADGPIPLPRTIEIIRSILEGLKYAHLQGTVHRDIKPENIQILSDGKVKITDFGIAKLMFEPGLTTNGQVFGTPSYMSPEQINGLDADGRSDLFSTGVMMYEMLSGAKPFTGNSPAALMNAILTSGPIRPSSIDDDTWLLISHLLEKYPVLRYQSAEEVLRDLDALAPKPAPAFVPPPPVIAAPAVPTVMSPAIHRHRSVRDGIGYIVGGLLLACVVTVTGVVVHDAIGRRRQSTASNSPFPSGVMPGNPQPMPQGFSPNPSAAQTPPQAPTSTSTGPAAFNSQVDLMDGALPADFWTPLLHDGAQTASSQPISVQFNPVVRSPYTYSITIANLGWSSTETATMTSTFRRTVLTNSYREETIITNAGNIAQPSPLSAGELAVLARLPALQDGTYAPGDTPPPQFIPGRVSIPSQTVFSWTKIQFRVDSLEQGNSTNHLILDVTGQYTGDGRTAESVAGSIEGVVQVNATTGTIETEHLRVTPETGGSGYWINVQLTGSPVAGPDVSVQSNTQTGMPSASNARQDGGIPPQQVPPQVTPPPANPNGPTAAGSSSGLPTFGTTGDSNSH